MGLVRQHNFKFYDDKKFGWEDLPELDKRIYNNVYVHNFFVKIEDITNNKYNVEMYGKLEDRDAEYMTELQKDINKVGLLEPLKVFQDACILVDGHHRLFVLKKLGLSYIPVSINSKYKVKDFEAKGPEGIAEMMDLIFRENSRPERGDYDRYETVYSWVVQRKSAGYDIASTEEIQEIRHRCTKNGLEYIEYTAINSLRFGHYYTPIKDKGVLKKGKTYKIPARKGDDDLLGSVKGTTKDGIKRKASNCVKNMIEDWRIKKLAIKLPRTSKFDNFVTSEDTKALFQGMILNLKNKINETTSLEAYNIIDVKVGDKMASGEKSTMCHRYLEAHFSEVMKYLRSLDYIIAGENDHFDYMAKTSEITDFKEFWVEFKTTIKGEKFTSNLPKNGYNLLVALNEENVNEIFVAYVHAENLWTVNAKNSSLDRKTLYKAIQDGKGKILFGDLVKNNKQHKFVYENIIN